MSDGEDSSSCGIRPLDAGQHSTPALDRDMHGPVMPADAGGCPAADYLGSDDEAPPHGDGESVLKPVMLPPGTHIVQVFSGDKAPICVKQIGWLEHQLGQQMAGQIADNASLRQCLAETSAENQLLKARLSNQANRL